jgi:transposase
VVRQSARAKGVPSYRRVAIATGTWAPSQRRSMIVTMPLAASTRIRSPVAICFVADPVPSTAGRPYSRAMIAAEASACTRPGEVGELLRREGLYTSHLTYWRKQRKEGALRELGRVRGRKPVDKRNQEIAELRRRAERAEAELQKAKKVIEIQGKCAARRSVEFPVQPGRTRRRFLGPMALPGSER